mmetsp:Transcript_57757/g.133398  ORF Transcript_57757/g.133398 Transcript_57757/m.133398 type:complete len:222 (-) Transcript_57757:166-831(-)
MISDICASAANRSVQRGHTSEGQPRSRDHERDSVLACSVQILLAGDCEQSERISIKSNRQRHIAQCCFLNGRQPTKQFDEHVQTSGLRRNAQQIGGVLTQVRAPRRVPTPVHGGDQPDVAKQIINAADGVRLQCHSQVPLFDGEAAVRRVQSDKHTNVVCLQNPIQHPFGVIRVPEILPVEIRKRILVEPRYKPVPRPGAQQGAQNQKFSGVSVLFDVSAE